MTLTDFRNKSHDYLKTKLPDVPEHTVAEIAAYLTNLASIAMKYEIYKVREEFVDEIKRRERKKYPATPANLGSGYIDGVRKCDICEHRYWHDPECSACNESNGFKYFVKRNGGGAADG